MDKAQGNEHEDIGRLKARIHYLERENQWYFSALDMTSSLGEIHRGLSRFENVSALFHEIQPLIKRMAAFDCQALLLVNQETSGFQLETCEPGEKSEEMKQAVDRFIQEGTFAWALQQAHGLWVEDKVTDCRWFLNSLATRSTTLGMMIGRLPRSAPPVSAEASKVLSIILQNTAQAMENLKGFQLTQDENRRLEKLVAARTLDLEQQKNELQLRMQELQDFTYLASHDLNEPLRKIITFSDRLLSSNRDKFDERALEFMGGMERAVHRMQTLIEGLLDLSRVHTLGRPFQETNLNVMIMEVLIQLDPKVQEAEASIHCDELPVILGDPIQLHHLFSHLLDNAIKFRNKENPPRIDILFIQNDPGFHQIVVRDNGIGIPEKQQGKIFRPFGRLHGRSEYPGVGIGLPLCKKIVERHQGSFQVESQPDTGTSFIIRFPAPETPGTL